MMATRDIAIACMAPDRQRARTRQPVDASGLLSAAAAAAPERRLQLIGAYGGFASIPRDVQRWVRSHQEAAMLPAQAPCQQRYQDDRRRIAVRIEDKIGAAGRLLARLDELGVPDTALLRVAFGSWQAPALAFTHEGVKRLARAVQAVTCCIPHLLIGAVEPHQGDFVAFSSEREADDGGISMDAVGAASWPTIWTRAAHGG